MAQTCWSKIFLVALVVSFDSTSIAKQPKCYRAAVLDHVQQNDRSVNDQGHNIKLNLKLYENAIEFAKKDGADIIVFPENGLVFNIETRKTADRYADDIPNTNQVLCSNSNSESLINRLSCLAKKHNIYLAADLVDRQPCKNNGDSKKCPNDKKFLFNTAVLFDNKGSLLAKYHKMHLFGEMSLNVPPKDDLVVVDTELGRLGLQICFDMIFDKPGHYLAKSNKVDSIVFPTWWFDEAPFLASAQYQMAWAFANNVTLLASNIHKIEAGSMGSGIYVGSERKFVNVVYQDQITRLVLGTVPIRSESGSKCKLDPKVIVVPQLVPPKKDEPRYIDQQMPLVDTQLVELSRSKNSAEVCHNNVCCSLEYTIAGSQDDKSSESYYLLASNRTRNTIYQWAEEFCGLVHCPKNAGGKSCSKFTSVRELTTLFQYAKLTGLFSIDTTIYPSAVGPKQSPYQLENLWKFSTKTLKKNTQQAIIEFSSKNDDKSYFLSTLALYGRAYKRDPPYEQKDVPIKL